MRPVANVMYTPYALAAAIAARLRADTIFCEFSKVPSKSIATNFIAISVFLRLQPPALFYN